MVYQELSVVTSRGGLPRPEDGCRALITGGSSGIGLALGQELVRRGAHVVLAARASERLDAAVASSRACRRTQGQQVEALPLELRDPAALDVAPARLAALLGDVDLLVHSAGITRPGYADRESDETWQAILETNFLGACRLTRAFLPHFVAKGAGHISFVSSVLGFAPYCASKAALGAYAAALREELLPQGVGVSVIFPAEVDTPMLAQERAITPWESTAMTGQVDGMSAQHLARRYLDAILAGKENIFPDARSRLTFHAARLLPNLLTDYFRLRLWLARRRRARGHDL